MPVGAVIPYIGEMEALPPNWVLCDGRVVDDPESPYHGRRVPNLHDRFVRGTIEVSDRGDTGGTNVAPLHGHAYQTDAPVRLWYPRNRASAWWTNGRGIVLSNRGHGSQPQTHWHYVMNRVENGSFTRLGTADVEGATADAGDHDNRPRFVTMYYIMRVK